MALSDKELDKLIHDQIKSELNEFETPDIDEQWNKVRNALMEESTPKNPSQKVNNLKRLTWVAALLIIVGAFSFINPGNANAFGEKIIEFYNFMVGKTTNNKTETYKRPGSPNEPAVTDLGTNSEKEVTLEQAQSSIPYTLATPNYLPPEFKLKRVTLTNMGSEIAEVSMEYEGDSKVIVFKQHNSAKSTTRGSLYDTDDTTVKDVDVNGKPGILFITKNNMSTLNWIQRDLVLQITGKIEPDEIIKIANSIL